MKTRLAFILMVLASFQLRGEKHNIHLVLDKAILHNGTSRGLELIFREQNGIWDKLVLGYATFYGPDGRYTSSPASFNKSDHDGNLSSITVSGNSISLSCVINLNSDPFVKGGTGRYSLLLTRSGDSLTGTFTGTYRDSLSVSGNVRGWSRLAQTRPVAGFTPVGKGEHPRLVFRKSELDSIRWRASNTPQGQAMVSALDQALARPFDYLSRKPAWAAASHAFKFALTGDVSWANETRRIVETTMTSSAQTTKMISLAPRYMGLAMAYDFCYDYWQQTDPAFRERFAHWLEKRMLDIIKGGGEGYNSHPMSNWMGIAYGSLGSMAMALSGDSVRFVHDEPVSPFLGQVPPMAGFVPGNGVSPTLLVPDSMPHNWIFAGPFLKKQSSDDCLAQIGGSAGANPGIGTQVTYDTSVRSFRSFPQNLLWKDPNYTGNRFFLDLVNAIGHRYFQTAYYFTALDVTTEGYRKLNLEAFGSASLVAWVAGKRLKNGDFIYLSPGSYPILVEATIGITEPWGKIAFRLTFSNRTQAQANAEYQTLASAYQVAHIGWIRNRDEYEARGKTVYSADLALRLAEQGMRRWLEDGLGDHGFYTEGEGYLRFALTCGAGQFLHGYQQCMGADFGEGYDSWRILPKLIHENVGGNMWAWGPAGWSDFGLQEERSGCMNMLFSNLYPAEKAPFRWMYDRETGLAGNQSFDIFNGFQAAYALKNYPFRTPAVHPEKVFPCQMLDQQKGYIVARNGWTYARDLVTSCYQKEEFKMGTHQASDRPEIRIQGFGKQLFRIPAAEVTNNVNKEQGSHLLQYLPDTNGSFVFSARMDDAYRGPYASNRYPDLGIRAHRSFANDFSGKSGAPGMYALVDLFRKGTGHSLKLIFEDNPSVSISGNDFVANLPNNQKLTGKLLLPASASLSYATKTLTIRGDSSFFLVMTLSEGAGPSFSVTGTGLNAVVQVGAQSIWYADSILHLQEINAVPSVRLVQPISGSVLPYGTPIMATAQASDADGIRKVEFFRNDTLVGADSLAPYEWNSGIIPTGVQVLKAKAWDTRRGWNISLPVSVTVVEATPPPLPGQLNGQLLPSQYVFLNWPSAGSLADHYILERKTGNGEYIALTTLNAGTTEFLDVQTCSGCVLFYRLRTANDIGISDPSNVVEIQITTGISADEKPGAKDISVFPNPFEDVFFLELDQPVYGLRITMFDAQGKVILRHQENEGKKQLIIPAKSFPKGTVFGVIRDGKGNLIRTFQGLKQC